MLPPPPNNPAPNELPDPNVRNKVRELLTRSEAFSALPVATQQQIAHDTTRIADYLVRPEGVDARLLADDPAKGAPAHALTDEENKAADEASFDERKSLLDDIGKDGFEAGAID